jgi:proteasome accessory factor A
VSNAQAKPFLMGAETEYAVSGRGPEGLLDQEEVYEELVAVIKEEHAWVADRSGYRGVFLEHGGRLYLDYGSHPEHATPECHTPAQVACYDKAGEALLDSARLRLRARNPRLEVTVVKSNLDPVDPDDVTYGTHESYTSWVTPDVSAPQLLPHLASRVFYAGAGALTAHPQGHGFELSQRARHLTSVRGHNTTGDRPLFGTRIRKDSDRGSEGWTRVHLISKDSQRAPFGIYLTYATTGLLIDLINRGHTVGRGLTLVNPLLAVQAFSRDPWLRARARLADGREMTALEIQSCYLEECARALAQGGLPEWAAEAVRHWRQTLEAAAKGPLALARRLDAYCKLFVYEHELVRAGYDWHDLRMALQALARLRNGYDASVVAAVVAGSPAGLSEEEAPAYGPALAESGVAGARQLERLRFAVRLQALDVNYHQLGGLYDRLRDARRVEHVVVTAADVDRATREPPPGGRAALRGGWIKAHAAEGFWGGDWQYLWHPPTAQCVDLRHPFAPDLRVRHLEMPPGVEPARADVLGLLYTQAGPA